MADLRNLYQEVILDHNKKPRNYGAFEGANREAHGHNPLCGDRYTIYLELNGETIERVGFEGEGCAISKAACSMMTSKVKGMNVDDADTLIDEFRALVMGELDPAKDAHHLGHLKVFEGVSALPVRVKCALLPWHALRAAIKDKSDASTEGDADPSNHEG